MCFGMLWNASTSQTKQTGKKNVHHKAEQLFQVFSDDRSLVSDLDVIIVDLDFVCRK